MALDDWAARFWRSPVADDDCSLVAYVDGELAGLTMLRVDRPSGRAQNNITGVRRAYRGRGLARLLKSHSLHRAAEAGRHGGGDRERRDQRADAGGEQRARVPPVVAPGRVGARTARRIGSPAMGLLDGKVAIVTGAGRGIGRGEAIELAREGARVVVNELDADAGQAVVDEIAAAGGEAVLDTGDCSEDDTARRLVATGASTRFGGLDALVNNAGILRDRTVAKMTPEEWDAVIKVHLRGHFLPTHAACAYWKEYGTGGHVVCTAGTSGLLGNFGQTNYGAAKAGIAAFATIVAMEMARYGVTVNAIAPAARTRMTEGAYGAKDCRPTTRATSSTSGTRTTSRRWSPTCAATPPGTSAARCSACRATPSSCTSRSRRSR